MNVVLAGNFVGRGRALTSDGMTAASDRASVDMAEMWAVVAVETSGCGFLADRRPQILFERHLFHALTHGRFDDGDISAAAPGGYGPPGPHQYERLARAIVRDREAALLSTSWGLGQILGKNYAIAGFADLDAFIAATVDS